MPNLVELSKEERKIILKTITEKDYKAAIVKIKSPISKSALRSAFQKAELSRVKLSELKSYVESSYELNDDIVNFYLVMVDKKLGDLYDYHNKLRQIIGNNQYAELTEDKKNEIESFRDSFNENPMPLKDFDTYIKFLCIPSDDAIEKVNDNIKDDKIEFLENELDKIKNNYNKLVTDYNDQIKQIKNLNNDLEKTKRENEKLNKFLKPNNIICNLNSMLKTSITSNNLNDVYEELQTIETQALEADDFDIIQKILAGKYAIVKLMKEGNK